MIVVDNLNKHFIRQGAQSGADWRQILRSLGLMKKQQELVKAVNGVSFRAEDGAITGLLGANGAGKTTTLRMIAALLPSDSGNILVDGAAVTPGSYATQSQMGVLSDARGLYPRLTARENIRYYGRLHGLSADHTEQRIEQLAQWLEMQPLLDRRTEGFSQGERMKTALARALVHDPKNIILDEPTNGLDVVATRALREFLLFLKSPQGGGKCIIVSTHIMQEVERLCDHVVIVAGGRNVAEGTVTQLKQLSGHQDFEDAFVSLAFSSQLHQHKEIV
ncbi:ABC transporter ATP-binding protein [Undibacterium squillarum]|uniref:Sodium ABC transporter ATP-binding protein n=1 Tax=Undibacterium squillarum TaxID=1131567 RepID=A0ABQ2XZ31_9BURK|nr:ATP-binding cassette domain-containing protein [Undibacterium squillarum]GGX42082.1 sodium ABC transporter ATP-binding protein [Undibacterium squillarum]